MVRKHHLAFLHDLVIAALTPMLAMLLRVGPGVRETQFEAVMLATPVFVIVAAVTYHAFGMYRGIWAYASVRDLLNIVKASSLAILVFVAILLMVNRFESIPRSMPVIQWLLLVVALGGSRLFYRLLRDRRVVRLTRGRDVATVPVLLVGAGDAAELFVRATLTDPNCPYRAVGILDPKDRRTGRAMHDVPVLGPPDRIKDALEWLSKHDRAPTRLVITDPGKLPPALSVRSLVELADRHGLTAVRMPNPTEFQDAVQEGGDLLRPIALEDLLNRRQTTLDVGALCDLIGGRRVLITGAGGTIGSELARQIAGLGPSELILADSGEYNLYLIDMEIGEASPGLSRRPVLLSVRDRNRLIRTFEALRPELVFHAAALKHVPLVELNPTEGVLTNAVGTRNVADAALACGALAMIQISTDKAVNPTGVMGASKRLAELYCQALDLTTHDADERSEDGTRFITVRFGNVLGSSGSVVPLFQRQLARGGPLTVTHPEIKRYFMTVREAVGLVLQASAHAITDPDRRGRILVLDMGEPLRIVDVAKQVIRLSGLRPNEDVEIAFTGLRPGEKLYEELFDASEARIETDTPGILGAVPPPADLAMLRRCLDRLHDASRSGDVDAVSATLRACVPGFAKAASAAAMAQADGRLADRETAPRNAAAADGQGEAGQSA